MVPSCLELAECCFPAQMQTGYQACSCCVGITAIWSLQNLVCRWGLKLGMVNSESEESERNSNFSELWRWSLTASWHYSWKQKHWIIVAHNWCFPNLAVAYPSPGTYRKTVNILLHVCINYLVKNLNTWHAAARSLACTISAFKIHVDPCCWDILHSNLSRVSQKSIRKCELVYSLALSVSMNVWVCVLMRGRKENVPPSPFNAHFTFKPERKK